MSLHTRSEPLTTKTIGGTADPGWFLPFSRWWKHLRVSMRAHACTTDDILNILNLSCQNLAQSPCTMFDIAHHCTAEVQDAHGVLCQCLLFTLWEARNQMFKAYRLYLLKGAAQHRFGTRSGLTEVQTRQLTDEQWSYFEFSAQSLPPRCWPKRSKIKQSSVEQNEICTQYSAPCFCLTTGPV